MGKLLIIIFIDTIKLNIKLNYSKGGDHSGRRFLKYSIFAWGFAALFIIIAIVMESNEKVPAILRPRFKQRCWFDGELE